MSDESKEPARRLLDPVDRVSEAIFGLIMALTFTCALSTAEAGKTEVRTMLISALGCNLAWGVVDGVMYLMATFVERGRGLLTLRAIRTASNPEEGRRVVLEALPPLAASVLSTEGAESLREGLTGLAGVPSRPGLRRRDWLSAVAVFLWVFLSTFPVAIPFMIFEAPVVALRVSNGVALVLLFAGGYVLGRFAAHRPWIMGLTMALVGSALVGISIALGG